MIEFEETLTDSKQKVKENQAEIGIIEVKNVPVQPLDLSPNIISYNSNVLELVLQDCQIMPQECKNIAESLLVIEVKTLDLSCNPIGLKGMCNLLNSKSIIHKVLQCLQLE